MKANAGELTEFRLGSVRSWPKDERPRERLLSKGAEALSMAELLAVVIGTGTRGCGVAELAQLIQGQGGREFSASLLSGVRGLGPAKVARILASVELGRRLSVAESDEAPRLTRSADVARFVAPRLVGKTFEVFLSISVDVKNRPIQVTEIARGGAEGVSLLPRDVFADAIRSKASGVICVHNHPSGDPAPSPEDAQLTERLSQGARLLGLRFLDHLVFASVERFFSFADAGRLK